MQSPLVISTLSLSSHQFLPLLFSHLKLFVIDVRMWPACFPQCVVKSRRSSSQSMGSDSQLAKDGVRYSQYPVRCVPVVWHPAIYCRSAKKWRVQACQRGAFVRLIGPNVDPPVWDCSAFGATTIHVSGRISIAEDAPESSNGRSCRKNASPCPDAAYDRK